MWDLEESATSAQKDSTFINYTRFTYWSNTAPFLLAALKPVKLPPSPFPAADYFSTTVIREASLRRFDWMSFTADTSSWRSSVVFNAPPFLSWHCGSSSHLGITHWTRKYNRKMSQHNTNVQNLTIQYVGHHIWWLYTMEKGCGYFKHWGLIFRPSENGPSNL